MSAEVRHLRDRGLLQEDAGVPAGAAEVHAARQEDGAGEARPPGVRQALHRREDVPLQRDLGPGRGDGRSFSPDTAAATLTVSLEFPMKSFLFFQTYYITVTHFSHCHRFFIRAFHAFKFYS